MRCLLKRPAVTSVIVLVAAGLAAGGCGTSSNSSTPGCLSKPPHAPDVTGDQ